MPAIQGNNITRTVHDTAGTTSQSLGGENNNITYVGDSGDNIFKLGGRNNTAVVANLGSDDKVVLHGKKEDWTVQEGSADDGSVTLVYNGNDAKGDFNNSVTILTDRSYRDDDFIMHRLSFTGVTQEAVAAPEPEAFEPLPSGLPLRDLIFALLEAFDKLARAGITDKANEIKALYEEDSENPDISIKSKEFSEQIKRRDNMFELFNGAIDELGSTEDKVSRF